MIQALDHLPKGTLADDFNQLEPISNVITLLDAVITLLVIVAIVYKSLLVRGFEFELVF